MTSLTPADLFPECELPEWSPKLALFTLKELGLQSSASALKAGHVCVKPASSHSFFSRAGRWVRAQDVPIAIALATEIRAHRELQLEEAKTALLRRLSGFAGSPLPEEVAVVAKQCLLAEPSKTTTGLVHQCALEMLRRTKTRTRELAGLSVSAKRWVLSGVTNRFGGETELTVPLPATVGWQLMLFPSPEGIAQAFSSWLDAAVGKAKTDLIALRLPAWVDLEQLVIWSLTGVPSVADPIHAALLLADTRNLAEINIHYKNEKYGLNVEVTHHGLSETLKFNKPFSQAQLFDALRGVRNSTTLAQAIAEIKRATADRASELLQDIDNRPESLVIAHTAIAKVVSGAEWAEMVRMVANKLLGKDPSLAFDRPGLVTRMDAELVVSAAKLRAGVLASQCRASLPATLPGFYPLARRMQRKLILVVGPTNSGKTYQALQRLKTATSGVYLGPLRLLALEVRDTLQQQGVPTSLVTGELLEPVVGARHSSSTIEMVDVQTEVEVAVIDEVQMVGDSQRGSAWTQAIMGAPAEEVWMLGAPEAEQAIVELAAILGEPLEIIRTSRLAPFYVSQSATALKNLPPYSAVVAFSRREVLAIAGELATKHGRAVSIIYGALSPEVRKEQARLFREGETDVVVATDAIGMGLNLPVKTIYFAASAKWNGVMEVSIPHDLVWQIAGRAGRFGLHETGVVSALDPVTLRFVTKKLENRPAPVPGHFRYSASWPIVSVIGDHLGTQDLTVILSFFVETLHLVNDPRFSPLIAEDQIKLASLIEMLRIPLKTRLMLTQGPVPMEKSVPDPIFLKSARYIEVNHPLRIAENDELRAASHQGSQEKAEQAVKRLTLYCWLHYRQPELFPDLSQAIHEISLLNTAITRELNRPSVRACTGCGKKLAWDHPFRICNHCHSLRQNRYDYAD